MANLLKIINISVAGWGILFSLISSIILLMGAKVERRTRNYHLRLFLCLALHLSANITAALCSGQSDQLALIAMPVANFGEYFFRYLFLLLLSFYVLYVVGDGRRMLAWQGVFSAVFALVVVLLIFNQFTGRLYFIDSNNTMQRGPQFALLQMLGLVPLLLIAVLIYYYHANLDIKERVAFATYVFLLTSALLLQYFMRGADYMMLGCLFTAIAMLIFLVIAQGDKYYEREAELADMRSAIMLSQIQPHFIYNTLGTIEQFCLEDPQQAADLVHKFALYLRGNFTQLDNPKPIKLSEELEYVSHYADIEKVRFPDMRVEYDLRASDFMLPPLTIQPLVENAIKHGLMGLESGGTVTVFTYETTAEYCVCVRDNGVGFDESALQDGRKHIGIANIRGRLHTMCGGTLTISSTPGQGTMALIAIPKEVTW